MKITKSEMNKAKKEFQDYTVKIEDLMSKYCGFGLKFPIDIKGNRLIVNARAIFSVNIPELIENIAHKIVLEVQGIIEKAIKDEENLDINFLHSTVHTMTRDISLSFIFSEYAASDVIAQHNYIRMVENLKSICSKTYESQPVDIGIIYCKDEESIDEVRRLEVDLVYMPTKKTLERFFLEEKPLLRLIDNKSFAVVIDKNFDVIGVIRKRTGAKSLSSIIESMYNNWALNDAKRYIFKHFTEAFDAVYDEFSKNIELSSEFKDYKNKLDEVFGNIQELDCPKFVYFTVHNKSIDIFTDQQFVINYTNGEWKLKHYNLMVATFMTLILTNGLKELVSIQVNEYEATLLGLSNGIQKFSDIVRKISQNNGSSIFLILLNNHLPQLEVVKPNNEEILRASGFTNNNLERNFINVIRSEGNHINMKDSDQYLLETVAAIDGAVVINSNLDLISIGEIIVVPKRKRYPDTFGTGTTAARYASRNGISVKISEDGDIYIFYHEKQLLRI
ncbi:diadenylate cyclase [Paenibacillus whitsoniae]|uniref:Uncharacterized protein n=1 Tax=Paenibacillus whitsoniae TaxID=2496558 RepID=A0A430JB46_9BACL|nr:diadenylate cyclase [Paenibacillus whitsoniae]RTE08241.1 hypothetical protein EJQ19_18560 [Paenibacillus whitsoniae]